MVAQEKKIRMAFLGPSIGYIFKAYLALDFTNDRRAFL
jgi:hypothetical protein